LKKKNYNLLILGDGEEYQRISSMIQNKGAQDNIFLLGYKKNIFKYIEKSKALICTSLWEEPGFIIQEAAACKKIILTSNCESGPSEFLKNGVNGFLFKSNNSESLIKNFNRMIKEKKKHKKMIDNNFKQINKYTKKYFVKKIIKELKFV
jgi:glycosyltransferase involved in cell wall biosynthesis